MSDKDKEVVELMYSALKSGYKITFEHNDIGAEKDGIRMYIGHVDELLKDMGDLNPWDYIDKKLVRGEK